MKLVGILLLLASTLSVGTAQCGPMDCTDSACWDDPVCSEVLDATFVPTGEGTETQDPFEDGTSAPSVESAPFEAPAAAPSSGLDDETSVPTVTREICDDGIDNDGDGFTDCQDEDCAADQLCGSWFEPQCSAYPECVEEGMTGDCCPTSGIDSTFLDCCSTSPSSCSVHSECVAEGLTGNCCPSINEDGEEVYLDCCDPRSCQANPKCSGLDGNCCATSEGVFLDCCEEGPQMCKKHPNCPATMDECCPNAEGEFLDCCEPRECSAHSACSDLNPDDLCCPGPEGIYLECCDLDLPFFAGSSIKWESREYKVGSASGTFRARLNSLLLVPVAVFLAINLIE